MVVEFPKLISKDVFGNTREIGNEPLYFRIVLADDRIEF